MKSTHGLPFIYRFAMLITIFLFITGLCLGYGQVHPGREGNHGGAPPRAPVQHLVPRQEVRRPPQGRPSGGHYVIHNRPAVTGHRPAYTRSAVVYGNHRYYAHHQYFYHPYRPYFWGPSWHPIGYFMGGIAAAAIIISIHNARYHYYNGVFYEPYHGGYRVIGAPIGAVIPVLPPGYITVTGGPGTCFYYGGCFYAPYEDSYEVIAAPPGVIIYNLPDGCVSVNMGSVTYLRYNGIYFMPTEVDGQSAYEVVRVQ